MKKNDDDSNNGSNRISGNADNIIDKVEKQQKGKVKRLLSKIINRIKKYCRNSSLLSNLLSFTSIGIGILAIWHTYTLLREETIYIGMTPFHVNDKYDLKEKYQWLLKPINKELKAKTFKIGYIPQQLDLAISDSYDEILNSLCKPNDIQMAFISLSLYNSFRSDDRYKKIDTLDFKVCKKDLAIPIGFKIMEEKHHYYSRIIWCINNKFAEKTPIPNNDTLLSSIHELIIKDSAKIFLGHKKSTSSYLLPLSKLKEQHENYSCDSTLRDSIDSSFIRQIGYGFGRRDMIDSILTQSNSFYFGALSNEDFMRIKSHERDRINYIQIEDTIPYDVVLANREWWENLSPRQKNAIYESFEANKEGLSILKYDHKADTLLDKKLNYIKTIINQQECF